MFTQRLLARVDEIAETEREEEGNAEPNRSEVIRALVRDGLKWREKEAAR